jgi:hypothetical protein
MMRDSVWVFMGAGGKFPSGVFTERLAAERWIAQNRLTGVLTRYPLDTGTYDWARSQGHFVPKTEQQRDAEFIGRFSSATQEHYHYENGSKE